MTRSSPLALAALAVTLLAGTTALAERVEVEVKVVERCGTPPPPIVCPPLRR